MASAVLSGEGVKGGEAGGGPRGSWLGVGRGRSRGGVEGRWRHAEGPGKRRFQALTHAAFPEVELVGELHQQAVGAAPAVLEVDLLALRGAALRQRRVTAQSGGRRKMVMLVTWQETLGTGVPRY